MKITILTIFPEFFASPLEQSLLKKAIDSGTIEIEMVDIRDYTHDKHKTVDDTPFGGGGGMVMKVEPLYDCLTDIVSKSTPQKRRIMLTSASGRKFDQKTAVECSLLEHLIIICGRYKGVDERIMKFFEIEEVSIGDYIINGGETASLVVLESVFRLIPGAISSIESAMSDSFSEDLLGAPVYTRPAEFMGTKVPQVLIEGNHARQQQYQRWAALQRTMNNRPDLLWHSELTDEDRSMMQQIAAGNEFDNCF
jgi:tRNA (guanine37-N1)-methyltransferase